MSEDKEKISAWLDDAIDYNEIDSLEVEQEKTSFSTVARYQMIGDALRGRVTEAAMTDISARLREAIEQEGALVRAARPASAPRRKKAPLFDFGSWLRPAGGLAVAATVAMVMVVTLTDRQTGTDSAIVADVAQQPVQALPVNNITPVFSQRDLAVPAINLNSYVTQHSEFAAQDTVQGMMPYARSVSYGLESRPPLTNTPDDRKQQNENVTNPGK